MGHLLGKERNQIEMLSLDELVAEDSPARQIDRIVDEADTSYFEKASAKHTGRPPFDPKDLLKLYLYGFENNVHSSRKLECECRRNIEVLWLMHGLTPDDKTISNFRKDNAKHIARFFNEFCQSLAKAGYLEELKERKATYEKIKERIESGAVTEVSLTDPDSRNMRQNNNGVDVSFNIQTAVDSKNKLIAGIAVTNSPADQGQLYVVAKAVKGNLGLDEMTVLGDKGYYKIEDFKACHEDNITTIVAKPEEQKNRAKGADGKPTGATLYPKSTFVYNRNEDCFYCPNGETLRFSSEGKDGSRQYSNCAACKNCPMKNRCTNSNRRVISRHKDDAHAVMNDKDFRENYDLYCQRQQLSEHPFGTVKRTMAIRQFLTRGFDKVIAETAMIFLCYNLKRLRTIHQCDPSNAQISYIYVQALLFIKTIVQTTNIFFKPNNLH